MLRMFVTLEVFQLETRTAELSCLVRADPECATVHGMSFASGS